MSVILAHEGAHIIQGNENVNFTCGYGVAKTLLPSIQNIDFFKKIGVLSHKDFPLLPELSTEFYTPTHLSYNKNLIASLQDLEREMKQYELIRSINSDSLGKTSSWWNPQPEDNRLHQPLYNQLVAVTNTLSKISRIIEKDADEMGLLITMNHENLTSHQKLQALINYKNYHNNTCTKDHSRSNKRPLCEDIDSSHPPCAERIEMIDRCIPHARIDIINETVREEIAWQ